LTRPISPHMKNFLKKIVQHKIISGLLLIGLVLLGLWKFGVFTKKEETRYVLAAVENGTIISSISGTGQISSLDEVSVKSKASGDVIYVGVESGDEVGVGRTLVMVDTTDAEKAIEDAKENLEDAQAELEKMKGITTEVGSIRGIKEKAQADLDKAYEDGFNNVSNTYLGLPTVMSGLQGILLSYAYSSGSWNMDYYVNAVKVYDSKIMQYREDAYTKYQAARSAYDQNFQEYKATNRSSDEKTIETLISDTYDTVKTVADAVKSANNLIQFYQDTLTTRGYTPQTLSTTHLSNLNTCTGTVNGYLTNLLSAKTTIQSDKESLIETDYTIEDQEKAIEKLEEALEDTQEDLENYTIYSPSAGTITAVNVKKGDSVSSGTIIATLVSKEEIAEITLNEVDVSNVKVGQKATLTFDALSEISITGKVIEVDTTGTASQGVVSYGIKISLDTDNDQIKPGMSITADIITEARQNVLILPSGAVKSQDEYYYVQLVNIEDEQELQQLLSDTSGVVLSELPTAQSVKIGISDDSSTEIISGLEEGDVVIYKTVSSSSSSSTETSSSSRNTSGGTMQILEMTTSGGEMPIGGPPGGQ